MKHRYLLPLVALLCGLSTFPAHAQKEKRADVSGFSFVTGPKGDRPRLPGLNAVLLLTDEQAQKLMQAREETVDSEAVVTAGRKVKGDPNATDADRQAARTAFEEARARYDRRVAEILTSAQKELVLRLQVLYGQSREAISADFTPRFASVKGNEAETLRLRREMQEALTTDFSRRVNEILLPEQRTAFERAAAEEKQRAEAAAAKKKGQ